MSLESIDTSYWLTKNKIWMDKRIAQWPAIERVVGLNRKKTEVNVIKQYFLRGKMPKWEKYREWDDLFRPLDLNMFLWLHPSSDPDVLKLLYRDYMESDLIHENDVVLGYGSFLEHELLRAASTKKSLEEYPFPFMGEKNIILFRIMFEDISHLKKTISHLIGGPENFDKKAGHIFEAVGYVYFLKMWRWLMQDPKSPLSLNSLYQYEDVLEYCMSTTKYDDEFIKALEYPVNVEDFQKALYCIHNFNTQKEGDTCRTRFVHKIRKILDEREFISEFKQMWEDTKAGKIEVKDPWKR